jgi:hypothetical protein
LLINASMSTGTSSPRIVGHSAVAAGLSLAAASEPVFACSSGARDEISQQWIVGDYRNDFGHFVLGQACAAAVRQVVGEEAG